MTCIVLCHAYFKYTVLLLLLRKFMLPKLKVKLVIEFNRQQYNKKPIVALILLLASDAHSSRMQQKVSFFSLLFKTSL